MNDRKPILCLDFDGVIHSYASGWKGADVIPDPPVAGAFKFIVDASAHFDVQVFSSRSHQPGGIEAMREWFKKWDETPGPHATVTSASLCVSFPDHKPSAMISIDDRAISFDGTWPRIDDLRQFRPWNKRPTGATGDYPRGKLNADDEGGLRMAIAADKATGVVRVDFGKPVAWLGLDRATALDLARRLTWHAEKIDVR